MNLTTVERFKSYKGLTGNEQNAELSAIIPFVSDQVRRYLRRDLERTTYWSWENGQGAEFLRLPQWPILSVTRVATETVMIAYVTFSGDGDAYMSVGADGLTLTSIGTDGVPVTTEIPFATYKSLATMRAAVNLITGWTMTIATGYDITATRYIQPVYGRMAKTEEAFLHVAVGALPVRLFDVDTIEIVDGMSKFPCGIGNVFVEYTAGYTLPVGTDAGTLPEGLELLIFQMISDVLALKDKNGSLQSESLGDYSYSLRSETGAAMSVVESRKKDLDIFRRVRL